LILLSTLTPNKVHAVDITVGATTWYAQWDFKTDGASANGSEYVEKDKPAFLYGPVLSAKITDDFSLTFVYLYGKLDMLFAGTTKVKYKRKDGDLALNYRLNDYFKLFAGIKYMGFDVPIAGSSDSVEHYGYGPGFGVSFTFPLLDSLFAIVNISGLYLLVNEKCSFYSEKFNEYGVNSSLSIAYYVAPASMVISLGGRYQYIRVLYEGTDLGGGATLSNLTNHIYGVTLTATYTFSI
jgi:hypothetical protein